MIVVDSNEKWLMLIIRGLADDPPFLGYNPYSEGEIEQIKQEATQRGIAMSDIERILRRELEKSEWFSERGLLDKFDVLLHQHTDDEKYLSKKEEAEVLDKIIQPDTEKNEGLDPEKAAVYLNAFCVTHRVKKESDKKVSSGMIAGLVLLIVAGVVVAYMSWSDPEVITKMETKAVAGSSSYV